MSDIKIMINLGFRARMILNFVYAKVLLRYDTKHIRLQVTSNSKTFFVLYVF